MRVSVTRKDIRLHPDSSRIIARFFMSGELRTQQLVMRVVNLPDDQVSLALEQTLRDFANRHRNISKVFLNHAKEIQDIIEGMKINFDHLSLERKMLLGAYCTSEYAIESAAIFNPSIIEDLDQTYLKPGEKRVIISFRATGEGHISSLVFRRAILNQNNDLIISRVGENIDVPVISHKKLYNKERFFNRMEVLNIPEKYSKNIMSGLPDQFEYYVLKNEVERVLHNSDISTDKQIALEEMTWLVDSFYDIQFHKDSDLSERVIFPISNAEKSGIEDARFVRFTDDDSVKIFATYTAYNGTHILPKLISTEDFYTFRVMPMHGNGARGKNLALFPRKIKGKYAMLARVDGVNNYIMYSDRTTLWNNPEILQQPKYPWEFTQLGNCGSPLWTEEGWLVITHGVGTMRRYCIGASLFDLDNPLKQIGRLKEPLLTPMEHEREGYVPNVVYSCGSLIHNNNLILPYAVSDYSSTYGVVDMTELLTVLKKSK